jgi:coenzyme F420-reducing hydrogenase delta subunit
MTADVDNGQFKILILASISGGYAGADSVGQAHLDYAPNTYVLPVVSPVIFSEDFYLDSFEKGIDAILVMFSGTDSPFKGDSERTAQIINKTYTLMKERGIDTKRLRLVAICTVCTKPFLKEINQINEVLSEIGFIRDELATQSASSPSA